MQTYLMNIEHSQIGSRQRVDEDQLAQDRPFSPSLRFSVALRPSNSYPLQ
jgi:hypothetical protein